MDLIKAAVKAGFPNVQLEDGVLSNIDTGEAVPFNEEEMVSINAKAAELQAEFDATEYKRKRKEEYNALNQFEMMYDDRLNGTDTWFETIKAIKKKHPKPKK